MSSTMDNKLKLCIAICDKLPPEEATIFNNAVAVSITPEQDQQLLHHTAILRLDRLLKVIPYNTNHYYQDTLQALQDTIAYHKKADTSPMAMVQAETTPRGLTTATVRKAHSRPCWAALHSAWKSIRLPHASQFNAAMCHEFSAILTKFTTGHTEWLGEYRQAAADVTTFLQKLNT